MLAIRFQRTGRTNDPAFRIVVSEKARSPKGGKPLAVVGSYNPKTKHTIIDAEAATHWISKGAQLSGTVNNLFITKGVIEGKKVNVLGQKTIKKEEGKSGAKSGEVKAAPATEAPKAEAPAEEPKAEEASAAS